jgi:8-oxo-dGTP pyrophosphatase MutT (NUDIX family)
VEFAEHETPEIYHAVKTADYVMVLGVTVDGRIPLVTQYRPAIEAFTLELPSGLAEPDEGPAATASRELLEETGYPASSLVALGSTVPDPGRTSNRAHSFFAELGERIPNFDPEPGIVPSLVTPAQLADLVRDGTFNVQLQLGTLFQAALRGLFQLPLNLDLPE